MSFKEWVLFVLGCLALGFGLIFGRAELATAAEQSAGVSIVQQNASVMRGNALTTYSDN